jgi:hypothetical protein
MELKRNGTVNDGENVKEMVTIYLYSSSCLKKPKKNSRYDNT